MAVAQSGGYSFADKVNMQPGSLAGRGASPGFARIVGAALAAVLLCAGFVGQRVYLMNLTYRLEAETAHVRQLAQENEFLQLQLARARSLDRIEAVARGRLGMVPASRRDVVVIPDGPRSARDGLALAATPAQSSRAEGGWLAALLHWANDRWPGRAAAEAGSSSAP